MNLIFIWFSFVLSASQILAFRQLAYEIRDLQETEKGPFEQEASYWTVYGLVSENKTTTTRKSKAEEPDILLGGPGVLKALKGTEYYYFERVYKNLPSHKTIAVTGLLWYFNDELVDLPMRFGILWIDGVVDLDLPPVIPSTDFNENAESSLYSLENNRFKFVTSHNFSTLILKVYSLVTKDPYEQSFGFRELTIHLSNFSASHSAMICDKFEGRSDSNSGTCLCPLNQAPDRNEVCQNCAQNCEICFGPNPIQCLLCAAGTHWDGEKCNSCHPNCQSCDSRDQYNCTVCSPGIYHYDNGSCLETCEWPFRKFKSVQHPNSCTKACKPDEYEWVEGRSCLAKCDSPLIKSAREDGIITCKSPCSNGQDFIYSNGSCISTCPAPLVAEFVNIGRFCKNPCKSAFDYLYANRSCLKECPLPLQIRSEPGINYCENPCHSRNLYLYKNGSCLSSCHAPMKPKTEFGAKYCLGPCSSNNEYILNNGSCSKECPPPMIKKFEASIGTYCMSPCWSADLFVDQNGSCLEVCSSPLEVRIENEIKYCMSPCSRNQYYFYQNRTCLDRCPNPLKITFEAGISLCQSPCLGQSNFFVYDDQSCYESCPSPLLSMIAKGGVNYCKSPCGDRAQYLDEDGKCIDGCEYPFEVVQKGSYKLCMIDMNKVQSAQVDSIKHIVQSSTTISEFGGLLSCFILPGDPTSILVLPLLQMFSEIENMNIFFPTQIKVLFDEQHKTLGERILTEDETSFRFTDKFKNKFGLLGVLIAGTLLLTCLRSVIKLPNLAIQALLALKWNILIPFCCSFYHEIVLYSYSEWSNISNILRLLTCMAVGFLAIFIPIKILIVYQKGIAETEKENWRFLFEVYKPKRFFVFIHILRVLLFSIIVSYLRNYPQTQAFLLFLTSLMMAFYLIWRSPIEDKLCFLQHMILESFLAVYNLLIFSLSILDTLGEKASEFRTIIDGIMIVEFLGAPIITALLISLKIIRCSFYFFQRGNKNNDFIQLSRINSSEQDGMDDKEAPETEEIITNITINKGDSPTLNSLNVNVSVKNTEAGTIEVQIRRSSGCLIKIEEKANDGGVIINDEWN